MDQNDDKTADYRCIVPFPDESASFVHGFEAGMIWGRMEHAEAFIDGTFHTENLEVYRRMAGARGYDIETKSTEFPEWTEVKFSKRRNRLTVVS